MRKKVQHGRRRQRRREWSTSRQLPTKLQALIPMSRSTASVSRYCDYCDWYFDELQFSLPSGDNMIMINLMIMWRIRAIFPELFCAVLYAALVHIVSHRHSNEQLLQLN